MRGESPMLVLGIDTSGAPGSVSLCRGWAGGFEVIACTALRARTFSAQLVPEIAGLLERNKLSARDIDGYAVVSGPGSFTGLRVGLAAVKGLAEILQKPIAAISMLEVMAECASASRASTASTCSEQSRMHAVLDGSRGEFFVGSYVRIGNQLHREERLADYEELLNIAGTEPVIICESSVEEALRASGKSLQMIARPDSGAVARTGMQKIRDGEIVSAEGLLANYLRDADVKVQPRRNEPGAPASASPANTKWKT